MTTNLTQLDFTAQDFQKARQVAKELGYGENTAYTSGSALVGLFCLPRNQHQKRGCIIKTAELGLMFVQDLEDLGIERE